MAQSRLGFNENRRNWIKSCVCATKVSILVNRSPIAEFETERGLKQGDTLAPFLFLIVAEGLAGFLEAQWRKVYTIPQEILALFGSSGGLTSFYRRSLKNCGCLLYQKHNGVGSFGNAMCLQRYLFFSWRLLLNRLPTCQQLQHRGINLHLYELYVLLSEVEDVNHLFLSCSVSQQVGFNVFRWLGVITVLLQQMNQTCV